jgi:hypothetical protein
VIALVTKEDEEALGAAGFGINIGIKKNNNIVFIKTWALTKGQKNSIQSRWYFSRCCTSRRRSV